MDASTVGLRAQVRAATADRSALLYRRQPGTARRSRRVACGGGACRCPAGLVCASSTRSTDGRWSTATAGDRWERPRGRCGRQQRSRRSARRSRGRLRPDPHCRPAPGRRCSGPRRLAQHDAADRHGRGGPAHRGVRRLAPTTWSRPSDLPLAAAAGRWGKRSWTRSGTPATIEPTLDRWFVREPSRRPHFDLWQANRDQLEAARRLPPDAIHVSRTVHPHPSRHLSFLPVGGIWRGTNGRGDPGKPTGVIPV